MDKSYRINLLNQLDVVYTSLKGSSTLSKIFDDEWYNKIKDEIINFNSDGSFHSDSALMFFELNHPFRGSEIFENAQNKVLNNAFKTLTKEQKLIISLFGLDPLKTILPIWEKRFTSLLNLPFKSNIIEVKFKQLKKCRYLDVFKNHFFELSVLGFFAEKKVLINVEPIESMVDGLIHIDRREMLVEITLTSQELLSDLPGVHCGNINSLVDQVIYKTKKKAANGRQLALANRKPAILVLGRNRLGADDISSVRLNFAKSFSTV